MSSLKPWIIKKRPKGDYDDDWEGYKYFVSYKTKEAAEINLDRFRKKWQCCEFKLVAL